MRALLGPINLARQSAPRLSARDEGPRCYDKSRVNLRLSGRSRKGASCTEPAAAAWDTLRRSQANGGTGIFGDAALADGVTKGGMRPADKQMPEWVEGIGQDRPRLRCIEHRAGSRPAFRSAGYGANRGRLRLWDYFDFRHDASQWRKGHMTPWPTGARRF